MTREIKFRAWDTEENKWYKPVYRAYEGKLFEILIGMNGCVVTRNMDGVGIGLPRFEIMQYTGLKDKNGKEVYEGDILKSDLDEVMIDTVEWDADGVSFHLKNVSTGFSQLRIEDWEWEVIGNIYENPELLK